MSEAILKMSWSVWVKPRKYVPSYFLAPFTSESKCKGLEASRWPVVRWGLRSPLRPNPAFSSASVLSECWYAKRGEMP